MAKELEPRLARDIPVFSAASAFRYEADVPLLIPPVNAAHAPLVREQQKRRGWKGFIVPIPNCTTTGLAVTLAPLAERFGVSAGADDVACRRCPARAAPRASSAWTSSTTSSPTSPRRRRRSRWRPRRSSARCEPAGAASRPTTCACRCTCTRVAVIEGHTESVFVSLEKKASVQEVAAAMREWQGAEVARKLPSAPPRWIEVLDEPVPPPAAPGPGHPRRHGHHGGPGARGRRARERLQVRARLPQHQDGSGQGRRPRRGVDARAGPAES